MVKSHAVTHSVPMNVCCLDETNYFCSNACKEEFESAPKQCVAVV